MKKTIMLIFLITFISISLFANSDSPILRMEFGGGYSGISFDIGDENLISDDVAAFSLNATLLPVEKFLIELRASIGYGITNIAISDSLLLDSETFILDTNLILGPRIKVHEYYYEQAFSNFTTGIFLTPFAGMGFSMESYAVNVYEEIRTLQRISPYATFGLKLEGTILENNNLKANIFIRFEGILPFSMEYLLKYPDYETGNIGIDKQNAKTGAGLKVSIGSTHYIRNFSIGWELFYSYLFRDEFEYEIMNEYSGEIETWTQNSEAAGIVGIFGKIGFKSK